MARPSIDLARGRCDLPIYITESGIADSARPDDRRVRYMAGALQAMHDAISAGADVRGYLYWSLLDNFEWAEGYVPRFGLYRTDYKTMKRSPTGGLALYSAVIAASTADGRAVNGGARTNGDAGHNGVRRRRASPARRSPRKPAH